MTGLVTAGRAGVRTCSPRLGIAEPVAVLEGLSRQDWLALRRRGIGGSDVGAICGLDPYRSTFAVWAEKVGLLGEQDDNEPMRWGRILEPVVADEVEARIPELTLVRVGALLAHPTIGYLLANPDRLALWAGDNGIYEGKIVGHWGAGDWADDGVPDRAVLQGQHYLAVTGLGWVLYGALIDGQRLEVRRVERDEALIDHVLALEADFWEHVVAGEPPPPDGSRATTDLLGHLWDVERDAVVTVDPDEAAELIAARAEAIELQRRAELARAEVENRMKVLMGPAEVAADPEGNTLFTWKRQLRRGLDTATLRAAMYDVAAELETVSECRILRVKGARRG